MSGEAIDLAALRLRADINAAIRAFFAERGVLEVETPVLSAAGNTEPNIEGFQARFTGHVDAGSPLRWLRTSPEYPLKRLLAAGVGDCYELGRVFRNGEAGGRHNPEFTMLEWYRVGWDDRRLAGETIELVQQALVRCGRQADVRLTTNIVGVAPEDVRVDQTVHVVFEQHDDVWIPLFTPTSAEASQ